MTLPDNQAGTIRFHPGDRLKIIAMEFPVDDVSRFDVEEKTVRLQVEMVRYVPRKLPDTFDEPQRGEWIVVKQGPNTAPSNGYEWTLGEECWSLLPSIVREGAGSLQEGLLQPECQMDIVLMTHDKSGLERRVERLPGAVLQTACPWLQAVLAIVVGVMLAVGGLLYLRFWSCTKDKHRSRSQSLD